MQTSPAGSSLPRRHRWRFPLQPGHTQRLAAVRAVLEAHPLNFPTQFVMTVRPLLRSASQADLPAAAEELPLIEAIRAGLERGPGDPLAVQTRAAAMLYFFMHELAPWDPATLPEWMAEDYVVWMLQPPSFFTEPGESLAYLRRVEEWVAFVQAHVARAPEQPLRQRLAEMVALGLNLIPAYFADADLRPLLTARAALIASTLARAFPLDVTLPARRSGDRIRVGIVKHHWGPGTETYATQPLFRHLPRDRFEIVLYSLDPALPPGAAESFGPFVWRALPANLPDQVALIRADACDFLFFATNLTAVTHQFVVLAAFRLARLQVTSICSPATTGMRHMDVFLAGDFTECSAAGDGEYCEKLHRLPGSGICFDFTLRPPPSDFAISRAELGIGSSAFVFVSGANLFKINPELRRAWARILAQVPGSALVLYPFGPAWTDRYPAAAFSRCFQEELAEVGVASERLILLQAMPSPSDLPKVLALADLYLDSFPYTGATSMLDPLQLGLPVVTMTGDRLRFAQGAALLRELGLAEFVAKSADHYVELATGLATDRTWLIDVRRRIGERMAARPAFLDSERFSAEFARVIPQLVAAAPR